MNWTTSEVQRERQTNRAENHHGACSEGCCDETRQAHYKGLSGVRQGVEGKAKPLLAKILLESVCWQRAQEARQPKDMRDVWCKVLDDM
jgi:hypothetical protein